MCPVLMILLIRLRRRAPWTATLAVVAVTTGTAAAAIAPSTTLDHLTNAAATAFVPGPLNADSLRFYALPFRAWELLLGCSAMLVRSQWNTSLAALAARARPIFYAVPTALLAAAFMDLERRSWPNLYTLAVCLVTACGLLLVDTRPIPLERRISVARALAHVGSTSYSAYLWHWPLLGYLAYTNVDFGVSRLDYALYLLILTGLVAATYHTVEKRRLSISVRASVVLLIAFVVAGRYLGTSPRDKTWFREEKQQILASARSASSLYRGSGEDDREVRRAVRETPRADGGGTVPALGTGTRLRRVVHQGISMPRLGTERQTTEEDFERAVQSDGYRGTLMVMRWNAYQRGSRRTKSKSSATDSSPWMAGGRETAKRPSSSSSPTSTISSAPSHRPGLREALVSSCKCRTCRSFRRRSRSWTITDSAFGRCRRSRRSNTGPNTLRCDASLNSFATPNRA